MSYTKGWNANRMVMEVSSLYLVISYDNLNCINNLSVILIFARPAGGHKCIKEHLECKSGNQRHPSKVLNSDFYLCSRLKPHLTKTAQGRRHIKSKIE